MLGIQSKKVSNLQKFLHFSSKTNRPLAESNISSVFIDADFFPFLTIFRGILSTTRAPLAAKLANNFKLLQALCMD